MPPIGHVIDGPTIHLRRRQGSRPDGRPGGNYLGPHPVYSNEGATVRDLTRTRGYLPVGDDVVVPRPARHNQRQVVADEPPLGMVTQTSPGRPKPVEGLSFRRWPVNRRSGAPCGVLGPLLVPCSHVSDNHGFLLCCVFTELLLFPAFNPEQPYGTKS